MKNILKLALALIIVFTFSCTPDNNPTPTAPTPPPPNPNNLYSQGNGVTDASGNIYATIILGNGQEWMAENLKTTKYANGDSIPNVTDDTDWSNLITGAWAHYDNDSLYENPYGKLYNYFTVADPRNVCPTGWHVPTNGEWNALIVYLGGDSIAGGKMKSTGTQYWLNPNIDATNQSGFSGLPGSYRNFSGTFNYIGYGGLWWSSTEYDTWNAWGRDLSYDDGIASNYHGSKNFGYSIRCLED